MYKFQWIGSDLCVLRRRDIFPRGRELEVDGHRWRQRLSSEITARKSTIVHLVCVVIMYTIYEVYKDVASLALRTPSFLTAEAAGDTKRSAGGVSVTTS